MLRQCGSALSLLGLGLLLAAGCAEMTTTPDASTDGVEARFAIPPGPYTPGESYFGDNGYIEYVAGNTPVILSAPHGGDLEPGSIPDRNSDTCGTSVTTTTDLNTRELTLAVQNHFVQRFGTYPHVILVHLDRSKLDANRDIGEAACGNAEAEEAWREYHDFIQVAKNAALDSEGRGWYMDMHGHGHEEQRLELGYLLRGSQLDLSDGTLDASKAYEDTSSIKTLSEDDTGHTFSETLRGDTGLGTLYADSGFRAVPSKYEPGPEGNAYFRGGYNTVRHTCTVRASENGGDPGGNICGVQVEANYSGVRDTEANRDEFGRVSALVLETYLGTHWNITLGDGNSSPTADFTHSCTDLTCGFTDQSTDSDGTIQSWSWDFGDGSTSTQQNPSHSYAEGGTYTVALTVTDDAGAPDSHNADVTVGIVLSADGYKVKGAHHVDLTWSGATSTDVDVHRDGAVVATTANDGAYTDATGQKGGASYVYTVCEAGTATCSNEVTVMF